MKRKPRLIDYDYKLLEALSDLNDGIITFEKLNERFTTGGIMESLERLEANGVVSKGEGVEIRQGVYCNPSPSTVIIGKPYEGDMPDGYKRWLIHRLVVFKIFCKEQL